MKNVENSERLKIAATQRKYRRFLNGVRVNVFHIEKMHPLADQTQEFILCIFINLMAFRSQNWGVRPCDKGRAIDYFHNFPPHHLTPECALKKK